MGRHGLRPSPNVILAKSRYTGLAALYRLASKRKNRRTLPFFASIEKQWTNVRKELKRVRQFRDRDLSVLLKAEANIRKQYLLMLWYSTRPYGNKETKRVQSWEQGTVGPLNSLLNYAGARLRELAATRYPFPEPVFYQIRTRHDGSQQVLSQKAADTVPDDGRYKSIRWKAGYRGNANNPRVLLSHPTLPSMDFVDMIRAHLIELSRQCFIHNVPFSDSYRYIRQLIHRLKPFLDWIYTGGESGRKDFIPDAEKELRNIVLELRTLYGQRIGRVGSITRSIEEDIPRPTAGFLRAKVQEILSSTNDSNARTYCIDVLDKLDKGLIVDRDIEKLIDHMVSLSQKDGNNWHRILLSHLHHPPSLKSVVFYGDTMMEEPGDILLVGELPINNDRRQGKADVVLFLRREVSGRTVWTPLMVLDIKVKGAYDFKLFSEPSKSGNDYLPTDYVWKRELTDNEWEILSTSIPEMSAQHQLDAYENGLVQEYRHLVRDDDSAPATLWKGIILIDSNQSYPGTLEAFQQGLEQVKLQIQSLAVRVSRWESLQLEPLGCDNCSPRISIILSPSGGPSHILQNSAPLDEIPVTDPFRFRVKDDRLLTLYIPVASASSEGEAAAWVAKNWHLLKYLEELAFPEENTLRFIWLDFLGDFKSARLRTARFGFDRLYRQNQIGLAEYQKLMKVFQKIEFVDLSDLIHTIILGHGRMDIRERITTIFKESERATVIIDGWEECSRLIPSSRQHLLQILEDALLMHLPSSGSNVIWIDAGAYHSRMNPFYQRSCVSPLPYNSSRQVHLDEILWNLPLKPKRVGWQTPEDTELRVIAQDLPLEQEPWTEVIRVPHLRDWAKKFRGTSHRDGTIPHLEVVYSPQHRQSMYGRKMVPSIAQNQHPLLPEEDILVAKETALSLIPEILRPRGDSDTYCADVLGQKMRLVSRRISYTRRSLSLSARLKLDVERMPPQNRCQPFSFVTRGWMYDRVPTPDEYSDSWKGISRRPTQRKTMKHDQIDTLNTRRMELERLRDAAIFLESQDTYQSDLSICCKKISSLCKATLSKPFDENRLLEALKEAKKIVLGNSQRAETWKLLNRARTELATILNTENYLSLQRAMGRNEEILLVYGINLFLATYFVLDEILTDHLSPFAINLWSSVAEWQLHQMGFKVREVSKHESRSKYDFQAILSSLRRRANHMKHLPRPEHHQFIQRHGQLIWYDAEDDIKMWMFFPTISETRTIGAFFEDLSSIYFRYGWYKAVIDSERMRDSALSVLTGSDWERTPIVIVGVEGTDILFMKLESDDSSEWSMIGMLEYGSPPKGFDYPIRWIRISEPPPEVFFLLQGFTPASAKRDSIYGFRLLQEAASWTGKIRDVICHLSIDMVNEKYVLNLVEGSKTIARKETEYTEEISRFLREPLRTGHYLQLKDKSYVKWDYVSNVEYDDIQIEKDGHKEWVNLSLLKPLIQRYSFYRDYLQFPITARDLLRTIYAGQLTLKISIDTKLQQAGSKKYLKIIIGGLEKSSILKKLESERFGIFDIALLTDCEQLLDITFLKRYDVEIDVADIAQLRFPPRLEDYSRLHSAILSEYDREIDTEIVLDEQEDLKSIEKVGPQLELAGIEIEESIMKRRLDVRVQLVSKEEDYREEMSVFSISSELAKLQGIVDLELENEVRSELKTRRISEDVLSELITSIEKKITEHGIHIIEF